MMAESGQHPGSIGNPLAVVDGLSKTYSRTGAFRRRTESSPVLAVEKLSFVIGRARTLALVGESGSGKSTIARSLIGLTRPTTGTFDFDGKRIGWDDEASWTDLRRHVQMIFQDPWSSFDPRMAIGTSLVEPLIAHRIGDKGSRSTRAAEILGEVGMAGAPLDYLPHRFSGGQLQRLAIARALILEPSLLICDEPVSALDVSTQAQIVQLLASLQSRSGIAYLFIAHELATVQALAHEVIVLRSGRVVERGLTSELFANPREEYTARLIEATLMPDPSLYSHRYERHALR